MSEEYEVELAKIKLHFQCMVPDVLLNEKLEFRSDADSDFIYNRLRAQLSGYLWGEAGPTRTIKHPTTLWDALKDRWFPAWLLKRYPAQFTCHEINIHTLYPYFHISLPANTHVLKFDVRTYRSEFGDDDYDKNY